MILPVQKVVVIDDSFDPFVSYSRNQVVFNMTTIHDRMGIVVTGTAGDGVRYERIAGVIDTVYDDCFKLWPEDGEAGGGKIWFDYKNIEALEVAESK